MIFNIIMSMYSIFKIVQFIVHYSVITYKNIYLMG